MKRSKSLRLAAIVATAIAFGWSAFIPKQALAGCGTDDCSAPSMPYTKTCCRIGIRCEVFARRVCRASPPGYEYSLLYGNLGECGGGDAAPGQPGQAKCIPPIPDL